MVLTKEQIAELKKQLSEQIEHLPHEQRAEAQKHIDSMSAGAIESMLKQQQSQQQVFRAIIEHKIPSVQLDENAESIAILDIKPISLGHIIIIPKSPAEDESKLPPSAFQLAKAVSEKIKSSLNAKSCEIISETKFGECILNIIPVYTNPLNLDSPRMEKTVEELKDIAKKINTLKIEKKREEIKIKKEKSEENQVLKLDRRVP